MEWVFLARAVFLLSFICFFHCVMRRTRRSFHPTTDPATPTVRILNPGRQFRWLACCTFLRFADSTNRVRRDDLNLISRRIKWCVSRIVTYILWNDVITRVRWSGIDANVTYISVSFVQRKRIKIAAWD